MTSVSPVWHLDSAVKFDLWPERMLVNNSNVKWLKYKWNELFEVGFFGVEFSVDVYSYDSVQFVSDVLLDWH